MAKDMSLVKRPGHTSFNVYFKDCVPVTVSQNLGIVEWLDLVLKVGSVYPTTEITQELCPSSFCPSFQRERLRGIFYEHPILCIIMSFYNFCALCNLKKMCMFLSLGAVQRGSLESCSIWRELLLQACV